jgi:hypothetical protein
MDSLIIFSKLFNIPIVNGAINVPDDFNFMKLQPNIREIIYIYFYLVNKQINGLSWKMLGNYMNLDNEIKYIENIDPVIYYNNNITLNKLHKQDYDLIENNINNVKCPIKYKTLGWNLNYYYETNKLTLEDISKIQNSTDVLKREYIEINPDIFDLNIIFKRFNTTFEPRLFKNDTKANNYRLMCLTSKYSIDYNDPKWYSNSFYVLDQILSNQPKQLHYSFEEQVLNSNSIKILSNKYLDWFINNRDEKYKFSNLLQHCDNINKLFDLGIYVPTIALEKFNYNITNLALLDVLKIMPDFTNKVWSYYKNEPIINLLSKYNIHFKYLSKDNCIAFYNTFYQPTIEFYDTVFENKNFRIDDVKHIKRFSYIQAKKLIETWNEKRGSINKLYSILKLKTDYVDLMKLHNENIYKQDLNLINQIFNKQNHIVVIEYIIKNNIIINDHNDIELIKNPELIRNISWNIINSDDKFKSLFKHFIINDVKLDYDPNKLYKYMHLIDVSDTLSNEQIKELVIQNKIIINQNVIKSWLKINDLYNIIHKSPRAMLSEMFDEIYNKIIETNYKLDYSLSTKILESYIYSNSKLTFEDVYSVVEQTTYYNLGTIWIKNKFCDPPFKLWAPSPNIELQKAYTNYVSVNLPREYTERRFYDFMIKNKCKRSKDCTAIYTLFSNNNEHKIIFIDDNNILETPAKKRLTIPVNYETIKTFIGEELDTNNITMLTKINGSDFDKICGGNHLLDCFVYSDIKNIYRERTPLKQILEYFVYVLQMKFNVKVTYE